MIGLSVSALFLLTQVGMSPASFHVGVTDATTGLPVAGATVELVDLTRRAVTGTDGLVSFAGVPPGPQHVAVRRIGYRPHFLHAFIGSRGLEVFVVLSPMPLSLAERRVESAPTLALRDIDRPDSLHPADRVLTAAAIRAHPLLSEPDALLATVGGHVGARAESPAGLHVMGGASDQLAYLIDGIPVFNPYHAGAVFGAWNTDALEEVALQISPHSGVLSDALGGALTAQTRPTGSRARSSGGMSTAQSRMTMDFPLGSRSAATGRSAGLLVSGRLLFPALLGASREGSQIDADGSDGVARLELPLARGTLRFLAVRLGTSVSTASAVQGDGDPVPQRNDLEWASQSYGATWEYATGPWHASAATWRASTSSEADWLADTTRYNLESSLSETAGRTRLSRSDATGEWTLAGRAHRRRSVFVRQDGSTMLDLRPRASVVTAFAGRRQHLGGRSELSIGSTMTRYGDRWHAGPFADLLLKPDDWVTVSVAGSRRQQFAQSLRNAESITGNIFPADLYLNAGADVPVARSDQEALAVQLRPSVGQAVTLRVWSRTLSGLVLPAVGGDELAVRSGFATGKGRARGVSIDASVAAARVGALASYVMQFVRYSAADTTWTPESGATHSFDAGVRVFPNSTLSLSVSVAAVSGRRATPYAGAFEWEACNLRDRGCEFAGSSFQRDGTLGSLALPGYLRIDVGLRKHWHRQFGGRDALLGAYVTWANLLNRSNVLTLIRDPASGARSAVGMRPGSPLVFGIDWSF